MRIESVVVNGSLGTIGISLVQRLLYHDIKKVYAVVYPKDPRIAWIPDEAVIIPCDMSEIIKLPEMINENIDAFFHLAWAGTIGNSRDDMLLQTQNIRCSVEAVNTAKKLGCKVFVGVGSQAEHGRIEGKVSAGLPCFPTTGYGMAKLCAGQMTRTVCHQLGIRHIWARVLSVYGLFDSPLSVTSILMEKLFRGETPALTAGEQLWDYLFADDASDALIGMAEAGRDGAIYPLGSGQVRPLKEYFGIIRDCIDPSLPLGLGKIAYQPNQVMHLEADITELAKDTGFRPHVSFEDGASRMVEKFKERMAR